MIFIKKILISILILLCLGLTSCSKRDFESKTGFYLDTYCEITLYGDDTEHLEAVFDIIEKYDALFNADNENSDIYKINNSNGAPVEVSMETVELIKVCLRYKEISENSYEPLIYGLSSLWKKGRVPNNEEINTALNEMKTSKITVNGNTITLSGGAKFDPGSSAKGFISQKIADYLSEKGVQRGIINLGGNVQLIGSKNGGNYTVAIKNPIEDKAPYVLNAQNCAISTCGTYERFFEKDGKIYHHILDIETGYPKESELTAVTVIGTDGAETDILSTVCFLLGTTNGTALIETLEGYEAIFIESSENITITSGLDFSNNTINFK